MLYLISYDINERIYDYAKLKEAIKALGDYQHPLDSVWFVDCPQEDVDGISEALRSFIQPKDHLLVMQVQPGAKRQGWLPTSFWKWLRTKQA